MVTAIHPTQQSAFRLRRPTSIVETFHTDASRWLAPTRMASMVMGMVLDVRAAEVARVRFLTATPSREEDQCQQERPLSSAYRFDSGC